VKLQLFQYQKSLLDLVQVGEKDNKKDTNGEGAGGGINIQPVAIYFNL